jgi:hypothetical protein
MFTAGKECGKPDNNGYQYGSLSVASNHIRHASKAPAPQRQPHFDECEFDHRLQIPPFQFVTPLDFEKGFVIGQVRFRVLDEENHGSCNSSLQLDLLPIMATRNRQKSRIAPRHIEASRTASFTLSELM